MRIMIKKSQSHNQHKKNFINQVIHLICMLSVSITFEGRLKGNQTVVKELNQSQVLYPIRIQVP